MNLEEYGVMYNIEDRHWWYRTLRQLIGLFWTKHVAPGVTNNETFRVLDAGCGTGANLEMLRTMAKPTGIDFSPEAITFCRRRDLPLTGVASAAQLPFERACFDAVVSFDVLCHRSMPDKTIPLDEIGRVLKKGGWLMMNLPAYQWLMSSHDTAVHTDHRFTLSEVRGLLTGVGFELVDSTYWNTFLFPGILAVRVWRKWFPPQGSDLPTECGGLLNDALAALMRVECAGLSAVRYPFGLSLFVVARKK